MNWFKKKFKIGLNRTEEVVSSSGDLYGNPLRMSIFSASGGIVIQTTKYNQVKDSSDHQLYVITSDQDVGEQVSRILVMESLRG
jgi:hypothetical protein